MLETLLFNIFLYAFFEGTDMASNADDTTPYNGNLAQKLVIIKPEELSLIISKWFDNNYMRVNNDKTHLLISGNKKKAILNIDNNYNESEDVYELLGITIGLYQKNM